jgi:hypothetical protein
MHRPQTSPSSAPAGAFALMIACIASESEAMATHPSRDSRPQTLHAPATNTCSTACCVRAVEIISSTVRLSFVRLLIW